MESNRTANWDIVPNKVRMNIVRYMNRETKTAFRTCSKNSKALVDRTPLGSCYRCCIKNSVQGYMWELEYKVSKSRSSDEAQKSIIKRFENIDCFEIFIVDINVELVPKPIKMPGGQMNVEKLFFKAQGHVHNNPCGYNVEMNLLKQFNPKYLSHVQVLFEKHGYRECQALYDLPQIRLPKSVKIQNYSSIRNDQLLKLNATDLTIDFAVNITTSGVAQYLKKCISNELFNKEFCFKITFQGSRNQDLMKGFDIFKIERPGLPPVNFQNSRGGHRYTMINSPYYDCRFLVQEIWGIDNNMTVKARRLGSERRLWFSRRGKAGA